MLANNISFHRVESLYRLAYERTSVLAVAVLLAGSLYITPEAAAAEPVGEAAVLASSELTALEPGYEMLSLPAGVDAGSGPAPAMSGATPANPEQPDSALPGLASVPPLPDIDLERVQDLGSIVDDARKQAQTEYLAEKLGKPARVV